jgi:hypothetical protein
MLSRGYPERITDPTAVIQSLHAAVCAGVEELGLEHSLGSRVATYADELVILCRHVNAEQALQRVREIMGKLKLTVSEGENADPQGSGR